MACKYPQWRIPWSNVLERHPLGPRYQSKVHNDGVIIQRPEFESLKVSYPFLAEQIDQIPCGKCIQCRIAYSREWANRCMLELKTAVNALFITLTYDDEHLHFSPYVDSSTGEVSRRPMLWPPDLTKFMKRLRFWVSERDPNLTVRFYACGEYGENNGRPHYHLIVYNLPLQFTEGSHLFQTDPCLWYCDALLDLWPFGFSVYGDVNWQTCAYVARYMTKKLKGKDKALQDKLQAEMFPDDPWQHEFVRMSRMPGLAREYYDQKKDQIYETDEVFVNVKGSVQPVRPSKYYDRLYDVEKPMRVSELKKKRKKIAEQLSINELSKTDLTEVEYIQLKAESKELQAQRLVRPDF